MNPTDPFDADTPFDSDNEQGAILDMMEALIKTGEKKIRDESRVSEQSERDRELKNAQRLLKDDIL
jgi:hypothetical protein